MLNFIPQELNDSTLHRVFSRFAWKLVAGACLKLVECGTQGTDHGNFVKHFDGRFDCHVQYPVQIKTQSSCTNTNLATSSSSPLLLSSLELRDTKVSAPKIRARLGTAAQFGDYSQVDILGVRYKFVICGGGTILNLRTTASQKCAAVPRRVRI